MVTPMDRDMSHHHDHDYYRELLGAYALDALEPAERRELEEHLATCPECREELAMLRAATLALPLAAEEREPATDLRARIVAMASADGSSVSSTTTTTPASDHKPAGVVSEPAVLRPRWQRVLPWAAAAVFLLFALAMLGWNLSLRQSNPSTSQLAAITGTSAAPNARGQITYLKDRQVMILTVRDLPALKAGDVYQIWLIQGKTPVPVGVFDQTSAQYAISANPGRYQALAVTIEPGPLGSPTPTGAKVVVAPLSSS